MKNKDIKKGKIQTKHVGKKHSTSEFGITRFASLSINNRTSTTLASSHVKATPRPAVTCSPSPFILLPWFRMAASFWTFGARTIPGIAVGIAHPMVGF